MSRIPFAAPPVGERRFRAPAQPLPWAGVRDALRPGPTPLRGRDPETLIPEPSYPGDETLNVNVFTPAPGDEAAKLPVLVWFHGGAYTSGSSSSPWYDGQAFNRDGVVTVSVSYRLAFDGFGWISDAPANRAIRDWIAALEWVRRNIAFFGGDPDRVTIAGQSAGGDAVLTLLGMASVQHLFRAVASFSPAITSLSHARARRMGMQVARDAGALPTIESLSARTEAEVRRASQRQSIVSPRRMLLRGLAFGPVIDGELLERPTVESLAIGVGADKPLLLSTADDEFTMVVTPYRRLLRWIPWWLALSVLGLHGRRRRAWIRARGAEVRDTTRAIGRYVTDRVFRVGALEVLRARTGPTWAARFAHRTPVYGYAVHCSDIPYLFDCLQCEDGIEHLLGTAPPQSLATAMHAALVGYVHGEEPAWPAWNEHPLTAMVWDQRPYIDETAYAAPAALLDGEWAPPFRISRR